MKIGAVEEMFVFRVFLDETLKRIFIPQWVLSFFLVQLSNHKIPQCYFRRRSLVHAPPDRMQAYLPKTLLRRSCNASRGSLKDASSSMPPSAPAKSPLLPANPSQRERDRARPRWPRRPSRSNALLGSVPWCQVAGSVGSQPNLRSWETIRAIGPLGLPGGGLIHLPCPGLGYPFHQGVAHNHTLRPAQDNLARVVEGWIQEPSRGHQGQGDFRGSSSRVSPRDSPKVSTPQPSGRVAREPSNFRAPLGLAS